MSTLENLSLAETHLDFTTYASCFAASLSQHGEFWTFTGLSNLVSLELTGSHLQLSIPHKIALKEGAAPLLFPLSLRFLDLSDSYCAHGPPGSSNTVIAMSIAPLVKLKALHLQVTHNEFTLYSSSSS
jgi:hypothetical protein